MNNEPNGEHAYMWRMCLVLPRGPRGIHFFPRNHFYISPIIGQHFIVLARTAPAATQNKALPFGMGNFIPSESGKVAVHTSKNVNEPPRSYLA